MNFDRIVYLLFVTVLLIVAYIADWEWMTLNPLTWLIPAAAVLFALAITPGIFAVAVVHALLKVEFTDGSVDAAFVLSVAFWCGVVFWYSLPADFRRRRRRPRTGKLRVGPPR